MPQMKQRSMPTIILKADKNGWAAPKPQKMGPRNSFYVQKKFIRLKYPFLPPSPRPFLTGAHPNCPFSSLFWSSFVAFANVRSHRCRWMPVATCKRDGISSSRRLSLAHSGRRRPTHALPHATTRASPFVDLPRWFGVFSWDSIFWSNFGQPAASFHVFFLCL